MGTIKPHVRFDLPLRDSNSSINSRGSGRFEVTPVTPAMAHPLSAAAASRFEVKPVKPSSSPVGYEPLPSAPKDADFPDAVTPQIDVEIVRLMRARGIVSSDSSDSKRSLREIAIANKVR